jgi:hypothetical protein
MAAICMLLKPARLNEKTTTAVMTSVSEKPALA